MASIEHSIKTRLRRLEGISEAQTGNTIGLQERETGVYIAFFPDSKKGNLFNEADIERMTADGFNILVCASDGGIYINN